MMNPTPIIPLASYLRPFNADSLWNCQPMFPSLGPPCVPKSTYFPSVSSGAYSTGVFLASENDKPVTIIGPNDTTSVADPDFGGSRFIAIPRWPANVIPATGTDGHADIVDPVTKIVHSFWKLQQIDGKWRAAMYAWGRIDGRGFADPAHYYQGARAVGALTSAGIIRKHEIDDGDTMYRHALAMSLTFNALSDGKTVPAYVYPATSSDGSLVGNSGTVPQGARLMLPQSFDSSRLTSPKLRKIAETLKYFGAYVVDRNYGTPFVIYVENGADFALMPNGWSNAVAADLDLIRSELRQLLSAKDWANGDLKLVGQGVARVQKVNLMSMRGGWYKQAGTKEVIYSSINQQLEFQEGGTQSMYANANNTGMTKVWWAQPKVGDTMKFTAGTSGGASLRLTATGSDGKLIFDSGHLTNGQSGTFVWPGKCSLVMVARSGPTGTSTARAILTQL